MAIYSQLTLYFILLGFIMSLIIFLQYQNRCFLSIKVIKLLNLLKYPYTIIYLLVKVYFILVCIYFKQNYKEEMYLLM